jgi:integrase
MQHAHEYTYIGDKYAKTGQYAGKLCSAIRRADGKCIRGKNGNMLVRFDDGTAVVVLAKMLRKVDKNQKHMTAIFAPSKKHAAISDASAQIVDVLSAGYSNLINGMIGKSKNTRTTYTRNVAGFISFIQDNGIHAGSFGAYREHLAGVLDIAIQTKNAKLAAAAALLREAHKRGVLPVDITANVPSFKAARGHVKDGLTRAEVVRVLDVIRAKKNAHTRAKLTAMFYLMAAEGLRQMEVQSLTFADIDLKEGAIKFRGKGRDAKERFYITSQTAEALREHLSMSGIQSGYLFASDDKTGEPISLRAIRKYFTCSKYGIFTVAGVDGKSVHGFRHYNITATLEATGGDLAKTRRRSRHSGYNMLVIYDDERLTRAEVETLADTFKF